MSNDRFEVLGAEEERWIPEDDSESEPPERDPRQGRNDTVPGTRLPGYGEWYDAMSCDGLGAAD